MDGVASLSSHQHLYPNDEAYEISIKKECRDEGDEANNEKNQLTKNK
jgi:hypothetical protein